MFPFLHEFIRAVYEGKSSRLLNSFIEGQSHTSLETYFDVADGMVLAGMVFLILGLFIFWGVQRQVFKSRGGWILAESLVLIMTAVRFLRPVLYDAEWYSLIPPLRIAHPGFLAQDWTWCYGTHGHFVFDHLFSPLFIFLTPLQAALSVRLFLWIFLIAAFIKLAKTLGLKWWQAVPAFALWFYGGQSLPLWEWILDGVHPKCFGYLFLFLALDQALNRRSLKAAICAGIAASFYPEVGIWGVLALAAVLFPPLGKEDAKLFFKFCGVFFLFAFPGLIFVFWRIFSHPAEFRADYHAQALFRGTWQPAFFSWHKAAELLTGSLSIVIGQKAFETEKARKLGFFIAVLIALFYLGPAGKTWSGLFFVSAYPSRLGSVFFLLILSLSIFAFLGRSWMITALLMIFLIYVQAPQKLLKHTAYFYCDWKKSLTIDEDDFAKLAQWVNDHTDKESVMVTPPWEPRFALSTGRSQLIFYEDELMTASVPEWVSRLTDLNAGKPVIYKKDRAALRENYSNLSREQLIKMKARYGARYYLVTRARPDLEFQLFYSNPAYFLYDIQEK